MCLRKELDLDFIHSYLNAMKLDSKKLSIIILVAVAVCLMFEYLSSYYIINFSPITCSSILGFFIYVLFFIQVIVLIACMLRRSRVFWAASALVCVFALVGLKHALPRPGRLIIYGMQDRIVRDYGIDALRNFARDFDRLPNLKSYDFLLPEKVYRYEDIVSKGWLKKYPFLAWYSGAKFISESGGTVSVIWGGRPQWGFRVSAKGNNVVLPADTDTQFLRASSDVYFYCKRAN